MADRAPKEPELSGMFPPFGFALPFLCSLFVFPLLDWQRVMLKAYQEMLNDQKWAELTHEEAKRRGTFLLKAYLEVTKSRQERGQHMLAWQSDLVHGYLQMLEGVLGSFERKTMG